MNLYSLASILHRSYDDLMPIAFRSLMDDIRIYAMVPKGTANNVDSLGSNQPENITTIKIADLHT